MFNSIASYLWGPSTETEQGYKEAQSMDSDGEQLNTQQDEDWVVVGPGKGSASHLTTEVRQMEEENQERVEDPAHRDSRSAQTRHHEGSRSRALHSIGVHNVITPEQVAKQVHSARRVQSQKRQRTINKHKCEKQNKVQQLNSYTKGKNKQNKCLHPSGFKSSRTNQRM